MSNIYIEKLDDFMELVDAVKPEIAFANKYSEVSENKLLNGCIYLQFSTTDDVINHRYVEEIPSVQLPPVDTFLAMAAKFIDERAVAEAGKKLDDNIKIFYKKLEDSYAKVLEVFKSREVKVIDGYIK